MQTQPLSVSAHLSTRKSLPKKEIFLAEMNLLQARAAEIQDGAAK